MRKKTPFKGYRDGAIFATVVQQPYQFGYQSMTLMDKYLGGDKSVVPGDKKVIVPTLAITKDKVDEFAANLKKLRGH
jgi:ribose transport system substrate-binding protein